MLRLPGFVEFLIGFAVLVGSISALVYLNRKSELAVMRAGGMSVWQFLRPGLLVGLAIGLFASDGLQSAGLEWPRQLRKAVCQGVSATKPICFAPRAAALGSGRTAWTGS